MPVDGACVLVGRAEVARRVVCTVGVELNEKEQSGIPDVAIDIKL